MKEIRKDCPVCKGRDITWFANTYDKHYGHTEKNYDVYKCNKCKLLFLNPMIEDNELFSLYPEDYYNTDSADVNNIAKKSTTPNLIKKILIDYRPKDLEQSFAGKTVLDLGVGNCEQLYILYKKGADAYGTEIRESACKIGEKLGLKISKGTLLDANYPTAFFDYVRSNHSFEHLTEPEKVLEEFNRILKDGGKLFIGVPNTKSWTFKFFGQHWYYLGVPFHPFSYNVHNLILFAEQYGFKMQKIVYNANFSSLMYGIQILLNLRNKKKSTEGWFCNKFNMIWCHQFARLSNLFKRGDCIEITFTKVKSIF
jgi:SAM-dependent methyltransferase